MKLNPDCIRAVMMEIEKRHIITVNDDNDVTFEILWIEALYEALPEYTKEDIFYSVHNLEQAGYVSTSSHTGDDAIDMCAINFMTYEGHEFLDKIRDPERWKAVKSIMGAVRAFALDAVNQAANGIASAAISKLVEKYIP